MPPKRKAATQGGRSSKRSSGIATPASSVSSDEFTEGGEEADDSEAEGLARAKQQFSIGAYSKKTKPATNGDSVSKLFEGRDFSYLALKPDHDNRPLWIDPVKGRIILESFSPIARQAQEFLTTIAEPQSRPSFLHEYTLTIHSLYAAVSVGLSANDIITTLERFSKVPLPEDIKSFITEGTKQYGKLKLVLKNTQYWIESTSPDVLQQLLKDPIIGPCRIEGSEQIITEKASTGMGGLVIPGTKEAAGARQAAATAQEQVGRQNAESDEDEEGGSRKSWEEQNMFASLREDEDEEEETDQVHSFQIPSDKVETVQKRCLDLGLPIVEEYDFRNDNKNANLDVDLKPSAVIRPYQEASLAKMFGNGRAKSGIIVLPCGAGKTLVGITAACTIKKGVIILCTSSMSVFQWANELKKWSNINPNDIAVFTADNKDTFPGETGIIISTYSMVTQSGKRSHDSAKMMNFIQQREWGLMILDEVHVVPASIFRKVTSAIATHSKLGLTATLLREDDKIKDLNFLIGPKLYEANWMELAEAGHIAKVQCAEVWCPMTPEFYTEYLRETARKRMLLYIMNPRKFQACQFLIDYHERRGDKIIVFSDNVYALERYAKKLNKAYIYGGTPQNERFRILENFQHNEQVNTIFLSKIGDTSLDLPEATCLIQISSHYGSRRQEAQRLGRILRAKRRNDEGFNAFFYSLVSKDTNEMYYSSKRQAFLVDQGYAFKSITHLQNIEKLPGLAFTTAQERRELLQDVMLQNEMASSIEKIEGDMFGERQGKGAKQGMRGASAKGAKRMAGTLSDLSGGQDMAYMEYNKSRNKELKGKGGAGLGGGMQNAFIKKMRREGERRRKANTE